MSDNNSMKKSGLVDIYVKFYESEVNIIAEYPALWDNKKRASKERKINKQHKRRIANRLTLY